MALTTNKGTKKEGEFLQKVINAIGGTPTDRFLDSAKKNGIAQFTHDKEGNVSGMTIVVEPYYKPEPLQ